MNSDYLSLYRVLGVEPGCSWTELKLAYRRLVRRWHPDHREPTLEKTDDAEIKAVNTAFEALSHYYQEYGELPLPTPERTADSRSSEATAKPDPEISVPVQGQARRFGSIGLRYILLGAALAISYAIISNVFTDDATNADAGRQVSQQWRSASTPPNAAPHEAADTKSKRLNEQPKYFAPGSTIGEVITAQGPPTYMEKSVWHYGQSRVYFRDGRVTHWEEDDANPLHAHLRNDKSVPSQATDFGVGSTKADVRSVQGTPMLETDTMWDYGTSRVYFKDDRVVSWEESPISPLHLRR